jgi:hypothetical protein
MGIRILFGGTCILLGLVLACAEGAGALVIDDFSTDQTLSIIATPGSASSQVSGAGILGGERDMLVTLDSGFFISVASGGGTLTHMQILSSTGSGLLVWDGADDDPAVDYTGLGGLDFTEGGGENHLFVPLLFNNLSAPIVLTAYTDAANFSTATVSLPGGVPPQAEVRVFFTDFVDAGASGGADFSNIGAFSLFIDGTTTQDFNAGFGAMTPEPSSATLLLFGILVMATIRRRRSVW